MSKATWDFSVDEDGQVMVGKTTVTEPKSNDDKEMIIELEKTIKELEHSNEKKLEVIASLEEEVAQLKQALIDTGSKEDAITIEQMKEALKEKGVDFAHNIGDKKLEALYVETFKE